MRTSEDRYRGLRLSANRSKKKLDLVVPWEPLYNLLESLVETSRSAPYNGASGPAYAARLNRTSSLRTHSSQHPDPKPRLVGEGGQTVRARLLSVSVAVCIRLTDPSYVRSMLTLRLQLLPRWLGGRDLEQVRATVLSLRQQRTLGSFVPL